MADDIARKRVGTTLGTHVNFYVDTILTDPGFNAENVSATPPDLAPVMSRSYVAQ
jgi:NitT/TauT family transport system substrate-binding protein